MNITIFPKSVKVFKAIASQAQPKQEVKVVQSEQQKQEVNESTSAKKTVAKKTAAKEKVTKKPTKAVIGIFYNYYKRPLNYLFSLLKKARKTAEEKATVKSLMAGLRKAEAKYQKENKFSDSIVDMLINQRSLKLGRLEASFDPALAAAVEAKASKGSIGIFYNLHKRPLNYMFVLLKKARKTADDKKIIADILKGLRKAEKSFMKEGKMKDSIVDMLVSQRGLKLPKAA